MRNLEVIEKRDVLGKEFKIYGDFENPLFLAKDVAEWIEHSDVSMLLKGIDEDEKLIQTLFVSGQNRDMWFLTEDGLYEVLMLSRKPIAKEFKKQVKLILKEIRKTGGYIHTTDEDNEEDIMARALIIAQRTIDRKNKKINELNNKVEEQKPKIEFVDNVLISENVVTTTVIAKQYGMSARTFNKLLNELGIQYKVGGVWVLYSKYENKGYTKVITSLDNKGEARELTKWTQKGREFLYRLLRDNDIVPLNEEV